MSHRIVKVTMNNLQRVQWLSLPAGTVPMTVMLDQERNLSLYCIVTPDVTKVKIVKVLVLETGSEIDDVNSLDYVNTVTDGHRDWHVFFKYHETEPV